MLFSSSLLAGAAALSFVPTTLAQFVTSQPTGWTSKTGNLNVPVRYRRVPNGICETNSTVKSFSGYADVAKDRHVFFWFFESRQVDPAKAPLTVWLSGGPGASSMQGLFTENGPCRIDSDLTVKNNPWSMSEVSNVLFIDQPGDTGLSYTNIVPGYTNTDTTTFSRLPDSTCPEYASKYGTCGTYGYPSPASVINSTQNAAPVFYRALQGFLGAFPNYARQQINFATSDYGGHFLPLYSQYFDQRNKNLGSGKTAAKKIVVKSLSINAATLNPVKAYANVYNYTLNNPYDVTILESQADLAHLQNVMNGKGNCLERARKCNKLNRIDICIEAYTYCEAEVENIINSSPRSYLDIRYANGAETVPSSYVKYLNTNAVRSAIGAYVTYFDFNYVVARAFLASGELVKNGGTMAAVKAMLQQGRSVMLYSGDADLLTPWTGVEAVADLVKAPGWDAAGYANISVSSASAAVVGAAVTTTITSTLTSTTTMTTTATDAARLGRRQATSQEADASTTTSISVASPIAPLPTTTSSSSTATEDPSATVTDTAATGSPYPALSTEDGPAGVVKQANKFAFARIYNAGHSPGASRPDVVFAMWRRFISNTDVATGKTQVKKTGYSSKGTKKSTYKEGAGALKNA
ncbi:Carboxypeptidase Y A [Elsinoe australis]|uniref:Carboxypeptidase Y A n=1 Tax=Elsinoe australis TaxID=40998 RepID=A0A2P8ABK6_9PEZI|nr:Carboxypeptidase Y A [Elsinoe australis]